MHDLIYIQKPALILKRKIHLTSDCYQLSCYRTDSETKTLSNELPGTEVIIQLIELVLQNIYGCLGFAFFACLFVNDFLPSFDLAVFICQIIFSLNKVLSVLVHSHDHSCSHLRVICNFHHLTRLSVLNMLLNHGSTSSDITKNCIVFLRRNHLYILLNRNSAAQ